MFDATGRVIISIDRRRVEKSLVLKQKGYGKHNFNRTSNGTFSFYEYIGSMYQGTSGNKYILRI